MRRRTWSLSALCFVLLAVLFAALAAMASAPYRQAAAPIQPSASSQQAKAVEVGLVTDLTWGAPPADHVRTAALLRDIGSQWVRLSVTWADSEPSPGRYNTRVLRLYDRAVSRARQADQRILIVIYSAPRWASGSSNTARPPRRASDFAAFARFLAKRYADEGVDAYEIWNEPNFARFWDPKPSARAYARLLKAAYPAVKQGDPNARVVFGGLSLNDYAFLKKAYAAGIKGSFDVMAVHPFSCSDGPGTVTRDNRGRIEPGSFLGYREVRRSMVARRDYKPIWFTEFGWSTTSQQCGVNEQTQAEYLADALSTLSRDRYVQVAFWYNLRNNFFDRDADTYEARFGLVRSNFARKPAYSAFRVFATGSGT